MTPMLDKIAAGMAFEDTAQIRDALRELEARHNSALHSSRGLGASLRCTIKGWAIFYEEGYSQPASLTPRFGEYYLCPEDAIDALRERVEGWITKAEGEDADPCTEAARKAGCTCTIPFAHSASIDPPEPRVDRECPLHGRSDRDAERQKRMDDGVAP